MKKILLLLVLCMPVICFAQTDKLSNENMVSNIIFSPTEVTASAILELNFEGAQELVYKVFMEDTVVQEQNISKGNVATAKKLDLSTLTSGPYTVKIFVAETEVKQFAITKL